MFDFDKYIINWNEEKNTWLKEERGIGFEDVHVEIAERRWLDIVPNPGEKYKNQRILIIEINKYVYAVPFVISNGEKEIFLKTIYPSRKYTKQYKI